MQPRKLPQKRVLDKMNITKKVLNALLFAGIDVYSDGHNIIVGKREIDHTEYRICHGPNCHNYHNHHNMFCSRECALNHKERKKHQ